MIDTKKFGIKICSLRKKNGYSQEKFAEILCVSPQAISKWENGHALPEISLLPVLARLFGCTIDELLMSDYIPDEIIGLEDYEIIIAVKKIHADLSNFKIIRSKPITNDHFMMIYITVFTPKIELKLIQKIFAHENNSELFGFNLFHGKTNAVPTVYYINTERKILLTEDLIDNHIKGNSVMYIVTGIDKDCEDGLIYRDNLKQLIRATADFHSVYWENFDIFGKIGLPWHCESKENMFAWIYNMMEKPLQTYIDNIKSGNVVKEGIGDNNITDKELEYFYMALDYVKSEYGKYIDTRFHTGNNLTVIHRELHPGVTYMAKSDDRMVKFTDLHELQIGLCTDNLAMLIALHIDSADSLVEYYYQWLCKNVENYSYETFVSDYKLSVAVFMFFPIRLINNGIGDFLMRDRALKAFINLTQVVL